MCRVSFTDHMSLCHTTSYWLQTILSANYDGENPVHGRYIDNSTIYHLNAVQ